MRFASFIAASTFAAALGAATLVGAPAQAQDEAKLRLGQFSADSQPVDIYLDGRKTFAQVKFPLMSAYTPVPSGPHTIEVRNAGVAATDPAIVSLKADLGGAKSYLVMLVGPAAGMQAKLIDDDLQTPAPGKARVRVLHTANGGPNVDAVVSGTTKLFSNVAFGTATPYAEVDATKYDLSVREAGTTKQLVGKQITLAGGGVYSIAAVASPDGAVTLRGFADVAPSAGAAAPGGDPTGAEVTAAPTTTVAAVAVPAETAAPSEAAPVTEAVATEPAAVETEAAPVTEAAVEAPVTEAAPVETVAPVDTTPASEAAPATPASGVETGFGGLDGSSSSLATVGLGAAAALFVALGLRRRSAR